MKEENQIIGFTKWLLKWITLIGAGLIALITVICGTMYAYNQVTVELPKSQIKVIVGVASAFSDDSLPVDLIQQQEDIEKAKKALINAHNAGDKAAATKIATFIKSQQTATRQPRDLFADEPAQLTQRKSRIRFLDEEPTAQQQEAPIVGQQSQPKWASDPIIEPKKPRWASSPLVDDRANYKLTPVDHDPFAGEDRAPKEVKLEDEKIGEGCEDPFPVFVAFLNESKKTVEYIDFEFIAKQPGHSTNIAAYENYSSDRIISPKQGWGNCWYVKLQAGHEHKNLRSLKYEVKINDVRFKN